MADVEYSTDGGSTWSTPVGDAWPTESGLYLVRMELKNAPLSRRLSVKISSTDAIAWGVRAIIIKGQREQQEASLT